MAQFDPQTHVLLLDVDGVLVDTPDFYCSRFPNEAVHDFFTGPFMAISTGQSDMFEHLPALMTQIGREGNPGEFYREWLEYENRPNTPMLEAVRELRAQGWRVYLATNQEQHRTAHLLQESGLGDLVDGHFASYSVGSRKPDPAYYAEVTARLGAEPAQIVFWDDSAANTEAARAAGWQAFLFAGVAEFARAMRLGSGGRLQLRRSSIMQP